MTCSVDSDGNQLIKLNEGEVAAAVRMYLGAYYSELGSIIRVEAEPATVIAEKE